jgi:hypothetical protein
MIAASIHKRRVSVFTILSIMQIHTARPEIRSVKIREPLANIHEIRS